MPQFRNVPFDQGGMVERIPGYPFSAAYHLSAATLIKGAPMLFFFKRFLYLSQ